MTDFDRKIRELSRNVEIPKEYDKRIEQELSQIPKEEQSDSGRKYRMSSKKLVIAFLLICIVGVLGNGVIEANANIFDTFKLTLMSIFHIEKEDAEIEVESKQENIKSKPDLQLEMQEVVTDHQGVYLLIKITAPPEITFSNKISFDYFAFCEGENYNADKLIGGATDCYLLETMEEKPNVATYVAELTTDMRSYEGQYVTAYFKDLTLDPYGEDPQLLVEGMWSITFVPELTVKDGIEIEGDSDMVFPFVDTTATVQHIEITPLGMTLLSDVSNVPYEELGLSDTSIAIHFKMIDGSEKYISPYDPDTEYIVDSGNVEYIQEKDASIQKNVYSFSEALDVAKIVGVYIQELYVPIE